MCSLTVLLFSLFLFHTVSDVIANDIWMQITPLIFFCLTHMMHSQQELLSNTKSLLQELLVTVMLTGNSMDGYKLKIAFQLYFAMFINVKMSRPNPAIILL